MMLQIWNLCSFFKYISFVNVRIFPDHISKCAWNSSRLIKTSLAAFWGSFECALCQVFTRRISTDVSPFNKRTSCLSTSHTPSNKFIFLTIGPWIFTYLYWVGVHIKICLRTLYRYTIKALNKQDLSSQNKIKKIYSENRSPCFFFNYCQPCAIYYHKTTKTWLSYGNSKYISNEININLILII